MSASRTLLSNRGPALSAWAFALALAACVASPSGPDAEKTEPSGTQVSQPKAPAVPGVPEGCSLTWKAAYGDSVLYCPDLRPPAPR